jgi:hypothetical protein
MEHPWGPLVYLHEENNLRLVTHNILCKLNNNLDIIASEIIDTSLLDKDPLWEFVGLEDARIIRWNNIFYLSGVRRDTTTNGQGRMELSEIEITNNKVREISRTRIPAPFPDTSYCEKNWMPILDQPYTYVKWCNPTEVVRYNPTDNSCKTIFLGDFIDYHTNDFRGGSQVINYKGYYIAIIHETQLFNSEAGRKNGIYSHRFVVWDTNWNLIEFSQPFTFLNGLIEFCCGMTIKDDQLLITFGFQDNAAFVLSVSTRVLFDLLKTYAN